MKRYVTLLLTAAGVLLLQAQPTDTVKFISVPSLNGMDGEVYHYAVKAESNDTSVVPNGIIHGKVIDTLEADIPNVIIEVFKTSAIDSLLFHSYFATTDENGNYRISHVDLGTYKLRAFSPSGKHQSQWYEGKQDAYEADVISVVVDSPLVTNASFKLRGGNAIRPKVTLTGKVTNRLGAAISGANCRVVFVRAEFALNFGGGVLAAEENFRKYFELNPHDDFRLEGNSEFVFKTRPDSITGDYEIQLPAGRYIAFVRAEGYETEFYQEALDLLSSEIIAIPSPLPDVISYDFTLAPLPSVALGRISGFVRGYHLDGVPMPARVIAFRDRWRYPDYQDIARTYVTDTDSLGGYSFDKLLPGVYVVMAFPLGPYSPSFYTGLDSAEHRWKYAAKIAIYGNSADGIDIYVKPFSDHASGYTSIYGKVTMSGGNGDGTPQGSSSAGALVYAAYYGSISGCAITNADGNYAISGLAPGEYRVFVDKLGFNESDSLAVYIAYNELGAPIKGRADFEISGVPMTTSAATDNAVQPAEYALAQNFPNPFNPGTTISYALPNTGAITLKVYDVLGKDVATLVNGYQGAGRYNVTFNASNLSSGVYFYRLQSGRYHVVKKMVLSR